MTHDDLPLFARFHESERMSRQEDPESSHEAADAMVRTGKVAAQRVDVLAALRLHGPATSAELAQLSGLERPQVARRLPELSTMGLVLRGPQRHCTAHGSTAIEWSVV